MIKFNFFHCSTLKLFTQRGEIGYSGVRKVLRLCKNNIPTSISDLFRIKKDPKLIGGAIETRKVKISSNKINSCVLNAVKKNGRHEVQAWKNDEKTVYLSRVVNQEIDRFCKINNCCINDCDKEQVFNYFSKCYDIPLNSRCAQSSINHVILGSNYFRKKIDILCQEMNKNEKNRTENYFVNKLADEFYQKNIQNIDLNKFRSEVANILEFLRLGNQDSK